MERELSSHLIPAGGFEWLQAAPIMARRLTRKTKRGFGLGWFIGRASGVGLAFSALTFTGAG